MRLLTKGEGGQTIFEMFVRVFHPNFNRYQLCSTCNKEYYDAKHNGECFKCWCGEDGWVY